jgi:hypothetical protein
VQPSRLLLVLVKHQLSLNQLSDQQLKGKLSLDQLLLLVLV